MTDFRALCVELTDALDKLNCSFNVPNQSGLVERARNALAEPDPERLTVAQIKALPDNGENFIWEDPRGTGWIDLDGTFSRDDLQQLANSLPIATTRNENV